MVHGDDFTCLGVAASLDTYEADMQKAFECNLKGRLGTEKDDEKQMRVLNRIVTVQDAGLEYEPDPRHIELLARDLGIDLDSNTRATPGEKPTYNPEIHKPDENISDIIHAIKEAQHRCMKVSFNDNIDVMHSEPDMYDGMLLHGPLFNPQPMPVPKGCCKYTGLPHEQIRALHATISLRSMPHRNRSAILAHTLSEGAAWEQQTTEIIAAVSKKYRTKRIGVRQAKNTKRRNNNAGKHTR